MKRIFDISFSFIGLIIFSPLLISAMFLVWKEDKKTPFYIAKRVGKNEKVFNMVKLRSMVVNADKSGVDSTSENDKRITSAGKFIRKYKLDELSQLWNVLKGDMSFVGPRPNVKNETDLYTSVEKQLLNARPGITDFSSIVFADESKIIKNFEDPDLAYNQLIRPGKSKLGLFYIKNNNFLIDVSLILITVLNIFSRKYALILNVKLLKFLKAPTELNQIAARKNKLIPSPPPGSKEIVKNRKI